MFDKAFIMAVSATWTTTKTVEYFCHLKRASAEASSKAFVTAHCPERVKILLENERISDASIIKLAGYAHRYLSKNYLSRCIDIVKLLGKNACILAEVIGEVFVTAASKNYPELVGILRNDPRMSGKMVEKAFVGAAGQEDCKLVQSLYDKKILSPETILAAFESAAAMGTDDVVKEIVQYLSDAAHVPRLISLKAFVVAAKVGRLSALHMLHEGEPVDWPLVTLKEALDATEDLVKKSFIREVICDQLFDARAPERFETLAKCMDN